MFQADDVTVSRRQMEICHKEGRYYMKSLMSEDPCVAMFIDRKQRYQIYEPVQI